MTDAALRGGHPDPEDLGYRFPDSQPAGAHAYLWPRLGAILARVHPDRSAPVFDLGCGNGSTMNWLSSQGYQTVGVDPSLEGVAQGQRAFPHLRIEPGNAYDDLPARYGRFRTLYSLEVVEHVYYPRIYARTVANLLEPGGHAILSTPYHSYLKNLAMAVTGTLDKHFTALWDHGHIKFWSVSTLSRLMDEVGLERVETHRVGRVPALAKSMILVFRKRVGPE